MLSALTLGLPFAKESVEGIICNTLKSFPQVRGNHSLRFILKGKSLGALCSRALGHLHRFLPRVDVSCRTSRYQKIWLVETPIFFSFILWFHPVRRYVILFENICYFEPIFIKHFIFFFNFFFYNLSVHMILLYFFTIVFLIINFTLGLGCQNIGEKFWCSFHHNFKAELPICLQLGSDYHAQLNGTNGWNSQISTTQELVRLVCILE